MYSSALMQFARLVKTVYARVSRVDWDALAALALIHLAISYFLMRQFETGEITEKIAFWYFYVTTATTVGYGDVAPKTEAGRLLTTLWIMPGGIVLFTVFIAKFVHFIGNRWRKRMRGESDYSFLKGHFVILGWQGRSTQRMIEEIVGDVVAERREIVLCSTKEIENPLPELVKFVRDKSLNAAELHRRAGVAGAAVIIALGHDDNDTLAAALAAGAANRSAHLVAHFEQQSFADLLIAHCPKAEAMVSMSMEMMVRSAQDPGSSRIHQDLLSVGKGPAQFSMCVPQTAPALQYGALLALLKDRHDATLLAVADDSFGRGLQLNAPVGHAIAPGSVIYYMAPARIKHDKVAWTDAAAARSLSEILTH